MFCMNTHKLALIFCTKVVYKIYLMWWTKYYYAHTGTCACQWLVWWWKVHDLVILVFVIQQLTNNFTACIIIMYTYRHYKHYVCMTHALTSLRETPYIYNVYKYTYFHIYIYNTPLYTHSNTPCICSLGNTLPFVIIMYIALIAACVYMATRLYS